MRVAKSHCIGREPNRSFYLYASVHLAGHTLNRSFYLYASVHLAGHLGLASLDFRVHRSEILHSQQKFNLLVA